MTEVTIYDTRKIAELVRGVPGEPPAQGRLRDREARKLQDKAAASYGESRGWHYTDSTFTLAALAGLRENYSLNEFFDHPYCYRVRRRPVGIVVHLYGRIDVEFLSIWARDLNLRATILPPMYAWYYPGAATPVLYERWTEQE